jgi:ketosteroid isomerase-like protein
MKTQFILYRFILIFSFLIGIKNFSFAQSSQNTNNDLYKEIFRMDSVLFNAFNSRDIDQFKNLFTEDLEFYHDKGGLTSYEYTVNSLKTTAKLNNQLKRELVKGSLEVYPIPGYGAMEIGAHTFCHNENGKQDCGTFKFVHIWKKNNDEWKITRVVSYGH